MQNRNADARKALVMVIAFIALFLLTRGSYGASLPVFPGAMGHGSDTKAGRGGSILRVTNLNDAGEGSLRAAIEIQGPRIIVFETSGTIQLRADLVVASPFVTIAGQTAPSPGINLRGAGLRIQTHDVLVQHIRVRVGDSPEGPSPSNRDALQVLGPKAYNVVVDHVSGSWGIDENMSTWRTVQNVTFSNNLICEGLYRSLHTEGPHSMGFLLGDFAKKVTLIGNLFAHNRSRNPQLKSDTSAEVVNNLVYNIGTPYSFLSVGAADYNNGPSYVSAVGNVFISGPNTPSHTPGVKVENSAPLGTQVYVADNIAPGVVLLPTSHEVSIPPIWHESLIVHPASQVEDRVLRFAGARPADRDAVDTRIVNEVRNRTGAIIDSQTEVGGWPILVRNYRPFKAPPNPSGDDDGDGYSNIEELLHQLATEVECTRLKIPIDLQSRIGP